jgi:hypothetical protein
MKLARTSLVATLLAIAATATAYDFVLVDTNDVSHAVTIPRIGGSATYKYFDFGGLKIKEIDVVTDVAPDLCIFNSGGGTSAVPVAWVRPGDTVVAVDLERSQTVFWVECLKDRGFTG